MALSPTCSPRCHPWCSPRCHPMQFHATLPLSFSYLSPDSVCHPILCVTRFHVSPDSTCHPIPCVTRFHVSPDSMCQPNLPVLSTKPQGGQAGLRPSRTSPRTPCCSRMPTRRSGTGSSSRPRRRDSSLSHSAPNGSNRRASRLQVDL